MLGTDLVSACEQAGHEVIGLDLPELDITSHDNTREMIPACDWLVNCAAYTDVDGAESHPEEAVAVNAKAVRNLAKLCFSRKIHLLHISTDYVFDGRLKRPYTEEDYANPLGIYGVSKMAGEEAIREEKGHHIILRTQSLFGMHGRNFVKSVIERIEKGEELHVVDDQISSPTYTRHLAEAILKLLPIDERGLVHVSGTGACSWYRFAKAIAKHVEPNAVVKPVKTVDTDRPAPRPAYSVMDSLHFEKWTGHRMPSWQQGLEEYLAEEGY